MRIRIFLTLGLLLCAAAPLAAQTYDTSYALVPRSRCVIPDSEMTRVAVYAWVDLPDSLAAAFRAPAEDLLQDVVLHVPPLLGAAPNMLPHGEPAIRWFDLYTPLEVTARRTGRITWQAAATRDAAAAGVLGRALAAALADGSAFFWDSTIVGDSVRFSIELSWPTVLGGGRFLPMNTKHTAIPVFSIAYPTITHVRASPGNRPAHYPIEARTGGYQATVIMNFLVDTTGRPMMPTAHDVWAAGKPRLRGTEGRMYAAFVDAARRALADMRFVPASVGNGCLFDEDAQMPFVFTLSR